MAGTNPVMAVQSSAEHFATPIMYQVGQQVYARFLGNWFSAKVIDWFTGESATDKYKVCD